MRGIEKDWGGERRAILNLSGQIEKLSILRRECIYVSNLKFLEHGVERFGVQGRYIFCSELRVSDVSEDCSVYVFLHLEYVVTACSRKANSDGRKLLP